jgi:hypothetical protein
VDVTVLWHLGLDARQFGLLLVIGHGDAALLPGFPALPDGGVIDVTAEHHGMIQLPLLFWSRLEPVFIGFADALLFQT